MKAQASVTACSSTPAAAGRSQSNFYKTTAHSRQDNSPQQESVSEKALTRSHSARNQALSASALRLRKLLTICGICATSHAPIESTPATKPTTSRALTPTTASLCAYISKHGGDIDSAGHKFELNSSQWQQRAHL